MFDAAARALRKHPSVESLQVADYGNALPLAISGNANLFVAFDGESLEDEICARLRQVCGRSALWVTEDPYEVPYNQKSSELFDLVFTNDLACVPHYGAKGRHLALAADPALHYFPVLADDDPRMRYDLCFIGYAWPNRVDLLRSLLAARPGLRVKLALVGNERLPIDLPLPPSSYTFRTSPREFARLANAGRVTLGLCRDFTTNPEGLSRGLTPPPRVFEAAAAGGFQLYDGDLESLGKYFRAGSEIVPFSSPEECKARLDWALSNPAGRTAVARAAQRRTLDDHTYDNRAESLLAECARLTTRPRERAVAPRRKRVLLVTGLASAGRDFGASALADGPEFEFLTYAPEETPRHNRFRLTNEAGTVLEHVSFDGDWIPFAFSNTAKERRFADILIEHRIDLVHFNHLLGHPLSLPVISHALGIKSVVASYDYYGLCDSFNLIDDRGRYCDVFRLGDGGCDLCTSRRTGKPHRAQRARRAFLDTVWSRVDHFIHFSESAREHYARFFPETMAGARVSVLAPPAAERAPRAARHDNGGTQNAPGRDGRPLTVAFLGDFTHENGGETLLRAADALRDEPIRFHVLGRAEPRLASALAAAPNVTPRGAHESHALDDSLAGVDVTLHLALWPETLGTTLAAAWANGCVPIVTDAGALAERVANRETGYVIRPDDAGRLQTTLLEILSEPEQLARLRENVRALRVSAAAEYRENLLALYRRLADSVPAYEGRGARAWRGPEINLFACGLTLSPWALKDVGESWRDAKQSEVAGRADDAAGTRFTPTHLKRPRPGAPGAIRVLDIDGAGRNAGTVPKCNGDTLSLVAVASVHANDLSAELLLVGENGRAAYACKTACELAQEREPLAAADRRRARLSGHGSLAAVVPGRYRVAVRYDDEVRLAEGGPTIAIDSTVAGPADFSALQVASVGARYSIDDLGGRAVTANPAPVIVSGRTSIRGWTDLASHSANAQTPWIVLDDVRNGERHFARATVQHRPDVAAALSSERLAYSGFAASLPPGALRAGAYELSLAAEDGTTLWISQPVLQIAIEG